MLTHFEAETIVTTCIEFVRGFQGAIQPSQTLKEVGIVTAGQATVLRNNIAIDAARGVPSIRNHRIKLSDLNVTTKMTVLQLQNTVLFFAFDPANPVPLIAAINVEVREDSQRGTVEIRTRRR